MYTFIISMVIVAIICLIIFKKDFWENRKIVLLIGSAVAFVAILSTNFSVKNSLRTKVVTNWTKPIQMMNLSDSLFVSDSVIVAKIKLRDLQNYFCEDSTYRTIITTNQVVVDLDTIYQTDTIIVPNIRQSNYFIYTNNEKLKIVYTEDGDMHIYCLSNIYIIPSESDTVACIIKKTKCYDPNTKWIAGFSLPKIKTIKCLCIPPIDYNKIPKSYLKDVPF